MRINQWEQESITKIQTTAKSARTDLQRLLDKAKNNLKTSVSKMTEEFRSSRESDDYTELNIKQWSDQLQEIRKMLHSPTTININYENDARAIIRLIKVTAQQSSNSFHEAIELHEFNSRISHHVETSVSERFVDTFGKVTLSKGGLVATCVGGDGDRSCVSGIGQYSSGVHYVRFRIEKIGEDFYSFFGIVNSSEKMTKNIWDSTSCYGWWDLDHRIGGGEMRVDSFTRITQTGDEVTLMLDCDNRRIQLEHHRTHRVVNMFIDLRFCAFPWKITVSLAGQKDCVRILH